MKQTEPWWTCNKCGVNLVKPGKKRVKEMMLEHRKTCDPFACFGIVQVVQGERNGG